MAQASARKLWALPGASLTVPASLLMLGADDTPIKIPAPAFLIEHPKGLLLFDTGCNSKVIDDPAGYWGPIAGSTPIEWSKNDTLDKQIDRVGYKIGDIKYVVLSHAHLDHAGGLSYFPQAKFIVGAGELRYAYWPDFDRRWAFIMDDFIETRGYDWVELGQDQDLFGDGAIKFLFTPGHTPGECSLLVNLPNRRIILTGDTAHRRTAFDQQIAMPWSVNHAQAIQSLKRVKALRDLAGAEVWISHDPDDWKEYPHQLD